MQRVRRVWLAWVCLCVWTVTSAQDAPPDEAAPPEEEWTYERFISEVGRARDPITEQIARQYELDDEQTELLRERLGRRIDTFVEDHGPNMFDLMTRARALEQYARENDLRFEDIDREVLRPLIQDALPLLDAYEEMTISLADEMAPDLRPGQRLRLAADRVKLQTGLSLARREARRIGGLPSPDDESPIVPDGGPMPGEPAAGPASSGRRAPEAPGDDWRRYVERFCRQHGFDELQKLRAERVLEQFLARLEQAERQGSRNGSAASQPASEPASPAASQPTTAEYEQQLRDRGMTPKARLFQEMVRELETIATPAQRRMAEETQRRRGEQP